MAKYLQEFVIHDYKGIHELKLDALNSINILTGDNNSGKTSVLEILSTVDNPNDNGSWVLCTRMKNTNLRNRSYYNGFYNIFPIDNEDKTISYEYKDYNGKLNEIALHAEMEEMQLTEKEMNKLNGLRQAKPGGTEDELVDVCCMHLFAFHNGSQIFENSIYDFQTRTSFFINKNRSFVRTTYVSPIDHITGTLFLNEILSDAELYEELICILKEFDEDIISVNALKNDHAPFSSEYMILTKKHEKALPLNAYGDGMKKALLLLSAIVRSRNGILLLDEFETAIHTSAMETVFSWLLRSALKLNVQVFLSSHSKEAIEKVLKVDSGLQPHINLYTLYNYEGKNFVRMMNCVDAIHAQDDLGLELR